MTSRGGCCLLPQSDIAFSPAILLRSAKKMADRVVNTLQRSLIAYGISFPTKTPWRTLNQTFTSCLALASSALWTQLLCATRNSSTSAPFIRSMGVVLIFRTGSELSSSTPTTSVHGFQRSWSSATFGYVGPSLLLSICGRPILEITFHFLKRTEKCSRT